MFDIHAMKNEVSNYNIIPRRIRSLAIMVALTIIAGGLVRQSAAQEPSPRIKVEAAPQVKVDLSSLDKLDEQLSLLDKMDFSYLDKMDFSYLDKMDFSYLDKMDFSYLDKMDFPSFDKFEKFSSFGKLEKLAQGKGVGLGVGRGVGSGSRSDQAADDDPCEFKIAVLQALIQNDLQRGLSVATEWLKPGSPQTVRCKQAALSLLARHGGKAAIPVILGFARNEPDPKLRVKAISV